MTLFIECIIGIILFTLIAIPMTLKDPLAALGDYPPAIRERCMELGLIQERKQRFTVKDIIRKTLAVIILILLLSYILKRVNHCETFIQGFTHSLIIWLSITWWDALVVDCIWFCHSPKTRIPGTEDKKEYHDYLFHIKQSCIGKIIGIPACILIGLVVML